MRPAPLPSAAPSRPGRRAMLGVALGASVVGLVGCGVRLEDDAPPIPLIPTREPIPAEADLLWLLEDCRALAGEEAPHTGLYAEQAAVLRSALFRAGIPIETLDAVIAPGPGATATSTPAPPPTTAGPMSTTPTPTPTSTQPSVSTTSAPAIATPDEPAADPATALERTADLAECGPGIFPVVMSLLAQRWAAVAATLGGGEPADPRPVLEPARLWQFPHLAAGFAEPTNAAIYGFEIVAAQSRDETRVSAVATLTDLRRLRREQTTRAGGGAPPPAFGYRLPFPVDSEDSALRLATHVLLGLTDAYGGLLLTVTGAAQQDTAGDVVAWLGAAAAHGAGWGAPIAAFPGTDVAE